MEFSSGRSRRWLILTTVSRSISSLPNSDTEGSKPQGREKKLAEKGNRIGRKFVVKHAKMLIRPIQRIWKGFVSC